MQIFAISLLFLTLAILSMNYKEKNSFRILIESFLIFLFGVFSLLYLISDYFTGEGINSVVISTLKLGVLDAGFQEYLLLILVGIFAFIFLFVFAFFYHKRLKNISISKPQRLKGFIHNGFFILAFLANPFFHNIYNIYIELNTKQSNDFYDYYKKPSALQPNQNDKNILIVYMESFEKTYFDDSLFPNLTPNLKTIIEKNGIDFTNIIQVKGSQYTIGGLTSTLCGIPLVAPCNANSMDSIEKFYPKAICMGDILDKNGYTLNYMQGASIKFAAKDKLL